MIFNIASVLLPVVELGIAFLFFERSYPMRKMTVWRVVIGVCLCGLFLLSSIGNRLIFHVPYTIMIAHVNMVLFFITGLSLFKVKWFRSFAFCLFYVPFISLLEFLGIVFEIVVENKPLTVILKYSTNHSYGIYLLILSLCMIIIFGIALKIKAEIFSAIINIHVIALIVLGCLIYIVNMYYLNLSMRITDIYLLSGLILSVIFIIISTMFVLLAFSYAKVKNEREHLIMGNNIISERIQALEQMERQRLKWEHDYKHQFRLLKKINESNSSKVIEDYLKDFASDIQENQIVTYTGCEIIDLILNEKRREAEKKSISFTCSCSTVKCSGNKKDLCVLLYNILDNALEAADGVINGKRFVHVEIMSIHDMLVLDVKNAFAQMPINIHGKFVTVKDDSLRHGYGVESVKDIVNKYRGDMNIDIGDCQFEIKVALPCEWGERK